MNRLERILLFLLILVSGVIIIALVVMLRQPQSPAEAAQQNGNGGGVAPTSTFVGLSALEAFGLATETAVSQQPSAQLLKATATWPQGSTIEQIRQGETAWSFTFFSPDSGEGMLVTVVDGQPAITIAGLQQTLPALAHSSKWQVDSDTAVDLFLQSGGENFIIENGVTTLTAHLQTDVGNDQIEWLLSLFSAGNGRSFTMKINADNGTTIEISET